MLHNGTCSTVEANIVRYYAMRILVSLTAEDGQMSCYPLKHFVVEYYTRITLQTMGCILIVNSFPLIILVGTEDEETKTSCRNTEHVTKAHYLA